MARSKRIDLLLVDRGLAESRSLAQRLIMAGKVRVDDQVVHKPSRRVPTNAQIDVDGREPAGVAYAWLLKEGFIRE